jgi:hypothetical protein
MDIVGTVSKSPRFIGPYRHDKQVAEKMLLGKARQQTATAIPKRSPDPPRENESRDPENATNSHTLVMHFHQDVSNLTVVQAKCSPKNPQSARNRITFHKTVRTSLNYARAKVLRQHRDDSTIGVLRLFVASFVAPKSLRMTGSMVFYFPMTIFSAACKFLP